MTKAELIKALEHFPDDMVVMLTHGYWPEWVNIEEIDTVTENHTNGGEQFVGLIQEFDNDRGC